MQIAKNTVVSLHYEMFDVDNNLIDKTEEPITYLHGGYDGIFPLVEEALQSKSVGDKVTVNMATDDAFGDPDDELIRVESIDVFPEDVDLTVGMMFEADDPETGEVLVFRITDIAEGKVVVDGNHPLAGQAIRFVATVSAVRAATTEEIAHGHTHEEGHTHH